MTTLAQLEKMVDTEESVDRLEALLHLVKDYRNKLRYAKDARELMDKAFNADFVVRYDPSRGSRVGEFRLENGTVLIGIPVKDRG